MFATLEAGRQWGRLGNYCLRELSNFTRPLCDTLSFSFWTKIERIAVACDCVLGLE